MHRPAPRLAATVTGCLAAAALLTAAPGSTAGAAGTTSAVQEVYRVPASGIFTVDGRGYGHGYGMSQWGAAQAAEQGVPASRILDFYYPGTTAAPAGNPWIKVALTGTGNGSTTAGYGGSGSYRYQCSDAAHASTYCALVVDVTSGLVVTDSATGNHPDTTAGVTKWQVTVAADGLHLAGWTGGAWADAPVGGQAAVTGPLLLSGPTFVRVDYGSAQRDYRGIVSATWTSPAGTSPARMIRLDSLHLDDYVRGVVYRESSSSWGLAALEAQAVAARSYAASFRHDSRGAGKPYDICDSTFCQVFGGSRLYSGGSSTWLEPDPAQPASDPVTQTADTIRLTSDGLPLWAEFSSSNGGWTAGGATYATPRYDAWDYHSADPSRRWSTTLHAASIASGYGLARLDELIVTQRDGTSAQWGGRVRAVRLVGVDAGGATRTVDLTSQTAVRFGMRSTFWHISTVTLTGPVSAPRGSTVALHGTASPGAAVTVYRKAQNWGAYAELAQVTADATGAFTARYRATVDDQYYAVAGGRSSAVGLTSATGTTVTGPATAARGTWVKVTGYAEPGAAVTLHVRKAGASGWITRPATTAGAAGWWTRSFYADASASYFADAAGQVSATRTTTVASA
ncbi:MAG: SpoIID/LytB domain-containing protein [Frankiaceae bacterium]